MDYKHGIYGETGSASEVASISQGTVPVYIGTLPIHRMKADKLVTVKHGTSENCIMLLISAFKEIKALNLYSDNWEAYSLCEALKVHFMGESDIAPIILIASNEVKSEAEAATATVNLSKSGTSYVGYLDDSEAIIDNMAITAESVTFNDGEVTYEYENDRIKIVVAKEGFTATAVTATYQKVSGEALSTIEFAECLELMDRVEGITGKVPNIICAPQYSDKPEFHDLMVQKAIEKIDEKWNVICASDLGEVEGLDAAIAWKKTNSYINVLDKPCYPMLGLNGVAYHMSVLWTANTQSIDTANGGIPYVTASNKPVAADAILSNEAPADGEARKTMYISEREANELNKNGITTAIAMKGQIRLWGAHMANYSHDVLDSIAVEHRTDIAVRMSAYLRNYLQYNFLDEVDITLTRKDVDGITNAIQMWLDSLVNSGMLYYAYVAFDGDSDIANGDIVFNIHVTYPQVLKSVTFKVIHTEKGLSVLTSDEEGSEE